MSEEFFDVAERSRSNRKRRCSHRVYGNRAKTPGMSESTKSERPLVRQWVKFPRCSACGSAGEALLEAPKGDGTGRNTKWLEARGGIVLDAGKPVCSCSVSAG